MNVSPFSVNASPINHCLEQVVKEVNDFNLTIYSYTGNEQHEPIYYEETILFRKMLEKAKLNCRMVEVSDADFSPSQWNPQHSLLHIPGATSSELDVHLGSHVEAIKQFVQQGGRFLGWCGGSYWACGEVCYRVNESSTLHKVRQLALWKGMEKGPLLPFLGNPEGNIGFFHGAVKLKWTGSETLKNICPKV